MTTINKIRHANLLALLKKAQNNQSELARRASTTASHINSVINRRVRSDGGETGIGNDLARKLESGFDMPAGWMDQDHSLKIKSPFGDLTPDEMEFLEMFLEVYRSGDLSEEKLDQAKKIMAVIMGDQ